MRLLTLILCLCSSISHAYPTLITDRNVFDALFPTSSFEDFESINVPEGSNITIPETLNSNTDTAEVDAGDVVPGISFTNPDGEIRILGHNDASYFCELSPVNSNRLSFENDDAEELILDFEQAINSFGLDIIGIEDPFLNISFYMSDGSNYSQDISAIFDKNTFFGWDFVDLKVISIAIDSVNDYYFAIDNVTFVTSNINSVPEPSTISLMCFTLFGFLSLELIKKGSKK